ncbi:sigma-70 family RNA polymerase sigma factor [Phenylobacterium sp.]|uniref:sigma-70 family RNA polymerase sigma factor n=1 Tax=Phenylobacterium sp. TaxID=1871053 RepID=UPI001209D196|nr:sigma-70 family RNA polymerase sigma factor [Phenylobacterium sp.]THD62701.1 MAG: sigma-70 family RNA polymerase sigma factor [Phenylobacterium sp.]
MGERKPFFRPRLAFSRDARPPREPDHARQFREVVLPHLDAAYNFARYLSRDPTAAEDIVQDAFLRAFKAFPNWRGGAPKAWLFAIVRNCFLDWVAGGGGAHKVLVDEGALSEAQAQALANVADPDQTTPEEALIRRREAETLRAVIENLPEPFRETLVLRELEELSYKEIAALTAVPIGTVMSRLARARQMLCDMLQPQGAALQEARR